MAERMARIGGVNIKELGRQLFSTAGGKSVEELVSSDFKEFHIGEQNLGVGQVTCLDSMEMLERKEEFLAVMRRLQEERHYNMVILMLTDVLLEGTQLLYVGSDEAIRNAFSAEPKDNALFLPGVMSRKSRSFPCCPLCGAKQHPKRAKHFWDKRLASHLPPAGGKRCEAF